MKAFTGLVVLFAATVLLLAPLPAQDEADAKKDAAKAEKKEAEKKTDVKKDEEKKAEAKKDEKPDAKKDEPEPKATSGKREAKKADPLEEKILRETFVLRARIGQTNAESGAGLSVELPFPYAPKIVAAQTWLRQQIQLGNRSYEVINQYKKKLNEARQVEVKPGENIVVRTANPPIEYDAKGNLKRWTTREIAALKGASRLPGFPAQFDSVRPGQIVDLYVAKVATGKRTARDPKEKKMEDEEELTDYPRPEVLMIVVLIEAPMRQ